MLRGGTFLPFSLGFPANVLLACGDLIERISYRDVTEEVLKSISGWHAGGVGLA